MANTFTSLHVHVVFSTKNRERWLTADVEEDVWRYPGGICRAHKFTALQIGGVDDHVHLLPGCPATVALSDFIKRLKDESSKWASGKFPRWSGFCWQDGYGAFSIGHSQIPTTIRYIQNQRVRHRKQRFEGQGITGVLIDERKARRIAHTIFGLEVRGTCALLVEAKRRQLIPAVHPALTAMIAGGYFIGPRLMAECLSRAGE